MPKTKWGGTDEEPKINTFYKVGNIIYSTI